MAYKKVYKILKKQNLIDKNKIYLIGEIVFSSWYKDYSDGFRCISIKDDMVIISRLGGYQQLAPLHYLYIEEIRKFEVNTKFFGLRKELNIKTEAFYEQYYILANNKQIKYFLNILS